MNKTLKYVLYVLGAIVLLIGSYQIVTKYTDSVLMTFEYATLLVAVIFLLAGIYKYREPLDGTVKDAWEGLGWVRNKMDPVYTMFILAHSSLLLLAIFIGGNKGGIWWWLIALTIALCHGVASVRTMSEQEKGVIVLFGRILDTGGDLENPDVKSGLFLAPWPMKVRRISKTGIKIDFGTLDESERAKYEKSIPSGSWFILEEPMHTNWGDIDSYKGVEVTGPDGNVTLVNLTPEERASYATDPLAKRMTTDPHVFFIMKVHNFKQLIEEVGGFQEAVERIRDVCISVLSEYAGKTFVAKALTDIGELNRRLKERVEELIGDPEGNARLAKEDKPENPSWGIDVTDLIVKNLGVHHDTNRAMIKRSVDIADADGDARAAIRRSEGKKTELINEGTGRAAAKTAMNAAEADEIVKKGAATAGALAARGKALDESPGARQILQTDAVIAGLKDGKAVFLPSGGISDLVSAVVTGAVAFDATKPKPTSPTRSPEERES